jgi:hypothetical protein
MEAINGLFAQKNLQALDRHGMVIFGIHGLFEPRCLYLPDGTRVTSPRRRAALTGRPVDRNHLCWYRLADRCLELLACCVKAGSSINWFAWKRADDLFIDYVPV